MSLVRRLAHLWYASLLALAAQSFRKGALHKSLVTAPRRRGALKCLVLSSLGASSSREPQRALSPGTQDLGGELGGGTKPSSEQKSSILKTSPRALHLLNERGGSDLRGYEGAGDSAGKGGRQRGHSVPRPHPRRGLACPQLLHPRSLLHPCF